MKITEYLENSQKNLLKKLVDEQEAYLKRLFGPGGRLEGQQNDFVLEGYPTHVIRQLETTDSNTLSFSLATEYRIRPKTPEEKNGRGEGTGSSGA